MNVQLAFFGRPPSNSCAGNVQSRLASAALISEVHHISLSRRKTKLKCSKVFLKMCKRSKCGHVWPATFKCLVLSTQLRSATGAQFVKLPFYLAHYKWQASSKKHFLNEFTDLVLWAARFETYGVPGPLGPSYASASLRVALRWRVGAPTFSSAFRLFCSVI